LIPFFPIFLRYLKDSPCAEVDGAAATLEMKIEGISVTDDGAKADQSCLNGAQA